MNDRAQARSEVATRLARVARHDLRGALNALHLHVQLLGAASDDSGAEARQGRAEHAAVVRDACRSLCSLLPLVVHPLPPPGAEVGLDRLVTDVTARLRPIATARGVTLETDAPPPLRLGGAAAEHRQERLVGALLDALEGARRGDSIRLTVGPGGKWGRVSSSGGRSSDVDLDPGDG